MITNFQHFSKQDSRNKAYPILHSRKGNSAMLFVTWWTKTGQLTKKRPPCAHVTIVPQSDLSELGSSIWLWKCELSDDYFDWVQCMDHCYQILILNTKKSKSGEIWNALQTFLLCFQIKRVHLGTMHQWSNDCISLRSILEEGQLFASLSPPAAAALCANLEDPQKVVMIQRQKTSKVVFVRPKTPQFY